MKVVKMLLLMLFASFPFSFALAEENGMDNGKEVAATDTLTLAPVVPDCLTYNERVAATLREWSARSPYDPDGYMEQGDHLVKEEKKKEEDNNYDWMRIFRLGRITEKTAELLISIFVGIIVLVVVIALCVILKNTSVDKTTQKKVYVDDEYDSLHAEEDLKRVVEEGDYKEAIRIVYLRTLEWLDRRKMITWEKSKTAIEYYYELDSQKRKKPMREMTKLYLSARYDKVVADKEMYELVDGYSQQICTRR